MANMDESAMSALLKAALLFSFTTSSFIGCVLTIPRYRRHIRFYCVVLQTYVAYHALKHAMIVLTDPRVRAAVMGWAVMYYLSLAEMLVVSRVNSDDVASLSRKRWFEEGYRADVVWQAFYLCFNLRRVGTRFQQSTMTQRPPPPPSPLLFTSRRQSHSEFIIRNCLFITFSYVFVDFLGRAVTIEPRFITSEKQVAWRLWHLNLEDMRFRFLLVLLFWTKLYFEVAQMVQTAAVVSVLLGYSEPRFWPALNGPLSSAQNLRLFWGDFWHQCGRSTLLGLAQLFSENVLRLQDGKPLSRYVRLVVVFSLSGILHALQDLVVGMDLQTSSTTQFFILQALGIMIEDATRILAFRLHLPAWGRSFMGYAWTAMFLYLTTPTWIYPKLREKRQSLHLIYPYHFNHRT